jgi:hypothetical protein
MQAIRWLAAFAVALSPTLAHARSRGLSVGDQAPMPVISSLDGVPTDLAKTIAERPALIEFWAT